MVYNKMISSTPAPRRLSGQGKENLPSHPLPTLPNKLEAPTFTKKTDQTLFSYPHRQLPNEHDREVIVDELTLHIHHDPNAQVSHPIHEHHLGEEALVPIALENLKMALDSRLRHITHKEMA